MVTTQNFVRYLQKTGRITEEKMTRKIGPISILQSYKNSGKHSYSTSIG